MNSLLSAMSLSREPGPTALIKTSLPKLSRFCEKRFLASTVKRKVSPVFTFAGALMLKWSRARVFLVPGDPPEAS